MINWFDSIYIHIQYIDKLKHLTFIYQPNLFVKDLVPNKNEQ